MIKKTPLLFDITIEAKCPKCGEIVDLEGVDYDYKFEHILGDICQNNPDCENFSEEAECLDCGEIFIIEKFER